MNKKYSTKIIVGMVAGALLLSLPVVPSFAGTTAPDQSASAAETELGQAPPADTLNPTGDNPHAANPRARITQQQREAAAAARKQKKMEIETRKKARGSGANVKGNVNPPPPGTVGAPADPVTDGQSNADAKAERPHLNR